MAFIEGKAKAKEKYNQALKKAGEKMYQDSLRLLEEAITLDPAFPEAYNLMGKVLLQIGDTSMAKQSWQKALHIDPANITAGACLDALTKNYRHWWPALVSTTVIILLLLQLIFSVILNRKVNLHTHLLKNVARDGTVSLPDNLNKKIDYLISAIREIKKELTAKKEKTGGLRATVAVSNESIEDRYQKALNFFREGKTEESRRLLMELPMREVTESLKDNVFFWIGVCLYKEERYAEAQNEFRKVIELYPGGNKIPEAGKLRKLCLKKMDALKKIKSRQ